MAHVHGAKAVKAITETAGTSAANMMDSAMSGMGKMSEGMMHSGMATMGNMGEGMMHSGMAGMGNMGEAMSHSAMKYAATAAAGKSTLKKILSHPITLVGFGFALGYLVYKYRHNIITAQQPEE